MSLWEGPEGHRLSPEEVAQDRVSCFRKQQPSLLKWKKAIEKLGGTVKMEGEKLRFGSIFYTADQLTMDPLSDEGCLKLSELTGIPLDKVYSVVRKE